MLARLFPGTRLYLKIASKRLHALDTRSGRQFDEPPLLALELKGQHKVIAAIGHAARQHEGRKDCRIINPFDHPRMLLGDFITAEALLRQVLKTLQPGILQPTLVLHPLERLEGGLSDMEIRAFHELGRGCGARQVWLWTGRELRPEEVRELAFPLHEGELHTA